MGERRREKERQEWGGESHQMEQGKEGGKEKEGGKGRREEEKERKGEGVNVGPCSDCLTPTD